MDLSLVNLNVKYFDLLRFQPVFYGTVSWDSEPALDGKVVEGVALKNTVVWYILDLRPS